MEQKDAATIFTVYDSLKAAAEQVGKKDFFGTVYVLEWTKEIVKIGCTRNLKKRASALSSTALYSQAKLGRVAVMDFSTNFRSIEKRIHEEMNEIRILGTELFRISFDEAIEEINRFFLECGGFQIEDDHIETQERVESFSKILISTVANDSSFSKMAEEKNVVKGIVDLFTELLALYEEFREIDFAETWDETRRKYYAEYQRDIESDTKNLTKDE